MEATACNHPIRVMRGAGWRRTIAGLPEPIRPPMSTTVSPRQETSTIAGDTDGASPADVLVIFGITGDLAKVMTFHSLYRLEQRGLIDCRVVGVAANDWT